VVKRLVRLTLLFAACAAPAQQYPLSIAQKGNWDINLWIAGATGEEKTNSFTEARIRTAGVFVGKVLTQDGGRGWLRGNLEYGVDFIPLFATSKTQRVKGGGFEPIVVRWNSSHHFGPVVPYIELAGGGVFTTANVPPGKTSTVNFTARAGGGIHIIARDHQSLDLGCRWTHLSNANLGAVNPQFNGVQLTLGYHWFK
jgi:lipid A 3-O-deacylase